MTEKLEYRVWLDDRGMFVAECHDDDGISELGEFITYGAAYERAATAALMTGAEPPEWDSELAGETDEDEDDLEGFEETDTPTFPPGLYISGKALVADADGNLWWVDPEIGLVKRPAVWK